MPESVQVWMTDLGGMRAKSGLRGLCAGEGGGGCWYLEYRTRAKCCSLRLRFRYAIISGMIMPIGDRPEESSGIEAMVREVSVP